MKNRLSDLAVLTGRLLIAALFVGGALQKGVDPGPAKALLAERGWPVWLIWPALGFNALAGLALIVGVHVRLFAGLLAGYCAVTSLFHFLPEDPWQMTIFVKNWAIAGGCLVLAAHGAGRFALRPDA
ncbi:MAG: DoxX family protein [Rhodobacteraceae bacterium]|nr:MAG: DoxX family protein [Paracoccaceae bacterium]